MDRKTAESYVIYGIKSTVFSKKTSILLLPFNIIGLGIATFFSPETYFTILILFIIVASIAMSIFFWKKWAAFTGLLSQGTQLFTFSLMINFNLFGIYQREEMFSDFIFLIIVLIEVLAFGIGIPLLVYTAEYHNVYKKPVDSKIIASFCGFISVLATILLKVFSPSFSMKIFIVCWLVAIILLNFSSFRAYYRAFLIKKFKLTIDLNNI